MTRIVGADPGLYGAIAMWDDDLDVLLVADAPVFHIKVGRSENRAVLDDAEYARLLRDFEPDRLVIERVNGIKGQSASASFNFGAAYGLLRGFGAMLGVPVDLVPPATWRARLHVPAGKDGSRYRASQLFPRHADKFARKKDDGRADAALLARCPGTRK